MGPVFDREGRAGPLSVDDCRCPVCLEIFMEPVTLPCSHTFCKVTKDLIQMERNGCSSGLDENKVLCSPPH